MIDLEPLVDLADLAVVRCEGVLPERLRIELAKIAQRARQRLGYLGDVLVVAFAGGTGSGKSSLLNAVLGEEVSQVGVARPTTEAQVVGAHRSAGSGQHDGGASAHR